MKVIARGYADGKTIFEESHEFPALEADDKIAELAERHIAIMSEYPLHVMELEFPDDPNPNARFYRWGTATDRMVAPVRYTGEPFTMPTHCFEPNCRAVLMGSWTKHTEECSIGRLIREFNEGRL